jgi:hypothetical protein
MTDYTRRFPSGAKTCETCLQPLVLEDWWTTCQRCDCAAEEFRKRADVEADADFAFHEVAHHVLLFRRLPRTRQDWRRVEKTTDRMPVGVAQIHELRVLAMQAVATKALGWNDDVARLVENSWPGLHDADIGPEARLRGRKIVWTANDALARLRNYIPEVSSRNVRMYVRAVRTLRGEACS